MTDNEYCDGFVNAEGADTVEKLCVDALRGRAVRGTETEGVLGLRGVVGRSCFMYQANTEICQTSYRGHMDNTCLCDQTSQGQRMRLLPQNVVRKRTS